MTWVLLGKYYLDVSPTTITEDKNKEQVWAD